MGQSLNKSLKDYSKHLSQSYDGNYIDLNKAVSNTRDCVQNSGQHRRACSHL